MKVCVALLLSYVDTFTERCYRSLSSCRRRDGRIDQREIRETTTVVRPDLSAICNDQLLFSSQTCGRTHPNGILRHFLELLNP